MYFNIRLSIEETKAVIEALNYFLATAEERMYHDKDDTVREALEEIKEQIGGQTYSEFINSMW